MLPLRGLFEKGNLWRYRLGESEKLEEGFEMDLQEIGVGGEFVVGKSPQMQERSN